MCVVQHAFKCLESFRRRVVHSTSVTVRRTDGQTEPRCKRVNSVSPFSLKKLRLTSLIGLRNFDTIRFATTTAWSTLDNDNIYITSHSIVQLKLIDANVDLRRFSSNSQWRRDPQQNRCVHVWQLRNTHCKRVNSEARKRNFSLFMRRGFDEVSTSRIPYAQ